MTYPCSAVGVVTRLRAGGPGDRLLIFVSSLERLDRFWSPRNLLSWYRIVKRSWTAAPPLRLYVVTVTVHFHPSLIPARMLQNNNNNNVHPSYQHSCWRLVLHNVTLNSVVLLTFPLTRKFFSLSPSLSLLLSLLFLSFSLSLSPPLSLIRCSSSMKLLLKSLVKSFHIRVQNWRWQSPSVWDLSLLCTGLPGS